MAGGKFHGVMAVTIPMGSFTADMRLPRCCCGIFCERLLPFQRDELAKNVCVLENKHMPTV
jgi:hypothetical protein